MLIAKNPLFHICRFTYRCMVQAWESQAELYNVAFRGFQQTGYINKDLVKKISLTLMYMLEARIAAYLGFT